MSDDNNALKCCMQQLLIELYRKKTAAQKDGAALEEPAIPDCPSEADYIEAETVPFAEEVRALPCGNKTLADLIREHASIPEPQINVFEVLEHSTEPEHIRPVSPPPPSTAPPEEREAGISAWERLRAWLVGREVWRAEKRRREYEYARKRTEIIDYCAGIDVGINVLEAAIKSLDKPQKENE